eukprot:3752229-Prymnesium_polylepis.1
MSRLPDLSKLILFERTESIGAGYNKRCREEEDAIVMPDTLFKQLQWLMGVVTDEVAVHTERFVLNLQVDSIEEYLADLEDPETQPRCMDNRHTIQVQFVKLVVDAFRAFYPYKSNILVFNHQQQPAASSCCAPA